MSEHCGSTSQSQALSFTNSTVAQLEGRLHELAEQDQQYRPRWGQINSRLAQLKNEYEALMREKNALVEEQGSIRVKVHERNEEYRRTQQAIAALTGARDSDSTRQNGLETAAAPPHGLPTVAKAPNPAMATTSSRIRPTEEVETIIIESDEEEEGEGDEALISVGTASRQLFKPVNAIQGGSQPSSTSTASGTKSDAKAVAPTSSREVQRGSKVFVG